MAHGLFRISCIFVILITLVILYYICLVYGSLRLIVIVTVVGIVAILSGLLIYFARQLGLNTLFR